jgi:hypothetical protein
MESRAMAYTFQNLGTVNRLRAYVSFPDTQGALNVGPVNLTNEGIRLALEGNATDLLPCMVGLIASPAPYMAVSLTMSLIRSMPLARVYKERIERNTLVGHVTVFPDIVSDGNGAYLNSFDLYNVALESIREMALTGLE